MGHQVVRSPHLARGLRGRCKGCLELQEDTGSELEEGLGILGQGLLHSISSCPVLLRGGCQELGGGNWGSS